MPTAADRLHNWLACALQVENFQIVDLESSRLENLVCLAPGVRVRACAACGPEKGNTRTFVDIDEVSGKMLPLG